MDVVACQYNERLRIALDSRAVKARSFLLSSLLPQNMHASSNALLRPHATFFYLLPQSMTFFPSLLSSLFKDPLRPGYFINFDIRSYETQPVDHEYPFSKESVQSPSNSSQRDSPNAVCGNGEIPPAIQGLVLFNTAASSPIMEPLSTNSHEGRTSKV